MSLVNTLRTVRYRLFLVRWNHQCAQARRHVLSRSVAYRLGRIAGRML